MKQMKSFLISVLVAMALPWQAFAADDFSGEKGYVDFGNLTGVYGQPRVQINLGSAMLGFVGAAAESEEPEVAEMISKLKQIRVLVYDIANDANEALETVDRITKEIEGDGWETIVMVNEENERVRIYAKMTNNVVDGLVVMAVDGSGHTDSGKAEAAFINIIGELDPQQVGRITSRFNVNVD